MTRITVALALALVLWPARAAVCAQQVEPPPQMDVADLLRAIRKQPAPSTNRSPSDLTVALLPAISANPAIGVGFGAVMSVAARRSGADGALSSAQASFMLTTKKQIVGTLRNDLHSRSDDWSLVGDVRLSKFVQRAPQLGSGQPEDAATVDVDYNWIRLYQTAYRRVAGPFHVGAGYHLDSFINIRPQEGQSLPPRVSEAFPVTSVASGVSADALFDSRDNPLNADRGVYARASYYFNPTFMGSDDDWQSLQLEGRTYVRLPSVRRQVLAAWAQSWHTLAGTPPYFNLPSIGWDTYGRTGRGYPAGRLRGKDWIDVEGEYRVDLMQNGLVGFVLFINASTFSDVNGVYGSWEPGGGAGFRLKLDKRNRTNLAMDIAWGRSRPRGFWFGLNEAF